MNSVWTDGEREFVRQNADRLTDATGAAQLSSIVGRNITVYSYRKQRQNMNVVKKHGRGVNAVNRERTIEKGGSFVIGAKEKVEEADALEEQTDKS